ncbi:MAG TPA: transposase [Candidatus Aveggerthella excrementigallinarum]|nr:transposase [Candidatus Aveggerthella excrementigallinarum]
MHKREDVEIVLEALAEGMSAEEAAELAGACARTVRRWAAGRLPRRHTGMPWGSGMMGGEATGERRARMSEKGLYDPPATGPLAGLEPAQVENLLLRSVLADLKAGGWDPASISNRGKCELGERLRLATGLPLRSITGFLRISRSSYEYHRARLGRDRDADFRLPGDPRRVYLSPCIDLFDGDVVAFSVGTSPSKALAAEMLAGAAAAVGRGFTLHSDRGWHHRTPDWARACRELGVTRSMSRKGHSPDNAACEGFFGRLKVEFFHGRDWAGVTAEEFIAELSAYVRWYREGRLKAFREGGRRVYDTIRGRRERLGLAV